MGIPQKSRIIVTCAKRISPYLRREIQDIDLLIDEEWSTGVALEGSMRDCITLNLNIRTANHVLYLIKDFKCESAEELYKNLTDIDWENIIEEDGFFSVTSNVDHPAIDNTMFANVKVKDAIVDRIREKKGKRPDSGSDRSRTVIHLFWNSEKASIFIDTSGETLARHGYRKIPFLAPMQESLAAATILSTTWKADENFINPMCGSGTLAIEAALMASRRAPGLLRSNYAFMHVKGYEESDYKKELKKIEEKVNENISSEIIATDNSELAVNAAKLNAEYAGVDHLIKFDICDYSETKVPAGKGVVMFNPEYGERLGDYDELELTYKGIGDFLKTKCKGYNGYILTSAPNLAKKVGLRASRKIEFYNSKLDCRLLEYELYDGTRREPVKNTD